MMKFFNFSSKTYSSIIFFLIFFAFEGFLFDAQVINGDILLNKAINNTYSTKYIIPDRGIIYTEDGKALVENRRVFDLYLAHDIASSEEFDQIHAKLNTLPGYENVTIQNELLFSNYQKQEGNYLLLSDIEGEKVEWIDKLVRDNKSLVLVERTVRSYTDSEIYSHILGYIGEPNEEDVKKGISIYSQVGRTGVEAYYDDVLRGEDGEKVYVHSLNGSLERVVKSPQNGDDMVLSINDVWQGDLYAIMEKSIKDVGALGGAGVIVESDSGAVKASVSFPGFDLNEFVGGIDQADYSKLLNDVRMPLIDRVVGMRLPPGSTFKPIVAISAMKMNKLDTKAVYNSAGCEDLSGIRFCEADNSVLGNVDFNKAIARSSNLYFCNLGRSLPIEEFVEKLDIFQIGKKTGIDLEGEAVGTLPSPEYIQKTYGRSWSVGDMCNTVIGQGVVSVTPMRMSLVASSFVNGGNLYQPYLVKQIIGDKEIDTTPTKLGELGIDADSLEIINNAMRQTVTDEKGSAKMLSGIGGDIRIKTGSAEVTERLSDGSIREGAHSWIIGSFEFEGKNYSFVVVQQFGGRGFKTVPIIGEFLKGIHVDD